MAATSALAGLAKESKQLLPMFPSGVFGEVLSDSIFADIDHLDGFEQLYSGGYNPPIWRDRGAMLLPTPNIAAMICTAIKRLTMYETVNVLTLEAEVSYSNFYGPNKLRALSLGCDTHAGDPGWTPRGYRYYFNLRRLFSEVNGEEARRFELKTGADESQAFTATTTNTSKTLTVVSSFIGLAVGMRLAGTGIPNDSFIESVNEGAGTLVMSIAATASNSGVTITPQPSYTPAPGQGYPVSQVTGVTAAPTYDGTTPPWIQWPPNENKRNRVFLALQVAPATGHYLGCRFGQSQTGSFAGNTASPLLDSNGNAIVAQKGILNRFTSGCNISLDNQTLIGGSQTRTFYYVHRVRMSMR